MSQNIYRNDISKSKRDITKLKEGNAVILDYILLNFSII